MLRRYFLFVSGAGLSFMAIFAASSPAFAASLSFSPAVSDVSVGGRFVVTVDVSSPDQALNAVSGDISFPSSKLRVLSVSNANSVMNLWVQNPTFSNVAGGGDVNFAGIVLNPGFIGSSGNVIKIRFQAIAAGDASISFSTASILANDGSGTSILSLAGTADVTIAPAAAPTLPAGANSSTLATPAVAGDIIPPANFAITEITTDETAPNPIFIWSTTDASSGIAKYMVKIGTGDWFDAASIAVSGTVDEYRLPQQAPGKNILLEVRAYDGADNTTDAATTFSIKPVVTVTGWFPIFMQFLGAWSSTILLGLMLLCAAAAVWERFHPSLSHTLLADRKELRDDLARIEKELEADQPSSKIDLSASGLHKKQARVRREIEHLNEDLKKDAKD